MKGRLVPGVPQLKDLFDEAHHARYTVHPGATKMYKDLNRNFGGRTCEEISQSMSPGVSPVSK